MDPFLLMFMLEKVNLSHLRQSVDVTDADLNRRSSDGFGKFLSGCFA